MRIFFILLWAAVPAFCATTTVTEGLSLTFNPAAKLSVAGSVSLTNSGTIFNPYGATLAVSYLARTVTGGTLTLRVTADFGVGGPSVASGNLQYVCSGATLGTACSGAQAASLSTSTPVLSLPASACTGAAAPCSNADPNSLSLDFTLANVPATKTGSYTATVQFTISAT